MTPVWIDDVGITCRRWNWRQTSRTAIHTDTTRVGFIIDWLDAPDHPGAELAAQQLASLLPVHAKFKFDGAEPYAVRRQVVDGYRQRNAPDDHEAVSHLLRRQPLLDDV